MKALLCLRQRCSFHIISCPGNKTQTSFLQIIWVSVLSQGEIDRLRMAPEAKQKQDAHSGPRVGCDRKLKGCRVGQVSPTLTEKKQKKRFCVFFCFFFQERRGWSAHLLGPAEGTLVQFQVEPLCQRLPLHHVHSPPCEEHRHLGCSL